MVSRLTQPRLGIVSAVATIVVSLIIVSLFSWDTFSGWVSVSLMCAIPTVIVVGAFGQGGGQPRRGLILLLGTAVVALVVVLVHRATVGGGYSPPVPMLSMAIITSVLVTFWLVIVWGGWPFSLIPNRTVAAVALLIGAYVVNAIQFHLFFDYGFLKGAPVYHAGLDPKGVFNAWSALVFGVTALAVMFLMLHFDLWPLTRFAALRSQPLLGLVWSVVIFVVTWVVFALGTQAAGMAAPVFMVRVSIPFIFGSILLLNTLQGSVFARLQQPVKGLASAVAAAVLGSVLAWGYVLMMPVVTGHLVSGAPQFAAELWLANALLAVTFPLLAMHGDYFGLWPFAAPAPTASDAVGSAGAETAADAAGPGDVSLPGGPAAPSQA